VSGLKGDRKPKRKFKPPSIGTRELVRALTHYGAEEKKGRGKGSHALYERMVSGRRCVAPVPRDSDLARGTIDAIRRQLKLTHDDGVSDVDFYGHA